MENDTKAELSDSGRAEPIKKGRVIHGVLPKCLQQGQFVMIFGARRPPNTNSCTGPIASDQNDASSKG